MPRALLGVVSLFVPIVLGGCQLLLDTNAPQDRVIVLGPAGLEVADAGGPSSDASSAGRVCPPFAFCEWFDTGSFDGWVTYQSGGTVSPDSKDARSSFALLTNLGVGAVGGPLVALERPRVTGSTAVKAATLDAWMKVAPAPGGQVLSLLELDADTSDAVVSASIELHADGALYVVAFVDEVTKLFEERLSAAAGEWNEYWLKLDTTNAQLWWKVGAETPQMHTLGITAGPANFGVLAGVGWAYQPMTAGLSARYDDLVVRWEP